MISEIVSADDLEELWIGEVPCGGVQLLGIPPCGDAATLVLDRRNTLHPCGTLPQPTDYKCQQCFDMWLDSTVALMASNRGYITCRECHGYFDSLTAFARYVPL